MPPKEFFGNVTNFLHFIRGYIDGDGCLCVYKDNNKVRTCLSLVGTENFLRAINHVFKGIGCLRSKTSVNYENKAFELKFSDVPSRKIARMLMQQFIQIENMKNINNSASQKSNLLEDNQVNSVNPYRKYRGN